MSSLEKEVIDSLNSKDTATLQETPKAWNSISNSKMNSNRSCCPLLAETSCCRRKESKRKKKHVSLNIEKKEENKLPLREDFLQALIFPHLDTGKRDLKIRGKPSRLGKAILLSESTSSTTLFRELFCPARTAVNIKLFGGKKGIEQEIERSLRAGLIIHPCSKFRQYWDLVIMTMLILNMFILPLDIAFFTEHNTDTWLGFHVFSDALCLLDIVLNFRTGYKLPESSLFELGQRKIAIHYIKSWFALDLVSSVPLNKIMMAAMGETENLTLGLKGASRALKFLKVTKLLNLLKLLRLSRIIRGISQYEEVYCLTATFMRYIKLVSMMLMVAHWNGCLHFLLPMLQEFPDDCWVKLCAIEKDPWYIQYGWAVFKTLSHMLCIGYGRFIPILLSEAIITIFSMVTGATFYALFIAHSMAYIIQNDSSKSHYQEKYQQMQEYMNYRALPDNMKKRVSDYFEHRYHQGRFFEETKILSHLSVPLRNDILNHTCKDFIEAVPFLQNAPEQFVTSLLNKLMFDVYLSGDCIVKEGAFGTQMFFIRRGSVEVSLNNKTLMQLREGTYFGEISVLTNTRRVASVNAVTTCDLFVLARSDLLELLDEFEEMRVVIEHSALSRLLNTCKQCEIAVKDHAVKKKSSSEEGPLDAEVQKRMRNFVVTALVCLSDQCEKNSSSEHCSQEKLLKLFTDAIMKHKSKHKSCDIIF